MKYDIDSIEKRRKKEKIIKNILKIVLIILIYNLILIVVSAMDNKNDISILGFKAYIITTNSMEPTIKIGDVVICKEANEEEIKDGDVITFSKDRGVITTHRVTKIEETEDGSKIYVTKGDNNTLEDEKKIESKEVKGKMTATIPKLGKIIKLCTNNVIILVILLVILILYFIKILINEKRDIRREKRKIEREKTN